MSTKKYSEDFPTQHTLIEKVIHDLKDPFKVDQTHDAEHTQVPQYTPNPSPTSPIVNPFVRSPPHTPTSVSSTMIPIVTLPPPVVLATTDESAPASVPVSTADVVKVALTNIPLCASNSYVMEPEGVINWIALIPTQIGVKQL